MSRRSLDILVPLAYVLALIVAGIFRDDAVLGAVAVFGAIIVGSYFSTLRGRMKS
jgi:hypothetical protein